MVWKTVNNSDAGTATKHGGNDLDKIASSFNGNNVSDPIIFKTDLNTLKHGTTNIIGDLLKHTGTKFDRFAKGTANQVLRTNATATDLEWATIAAGGDITGGTNQGSGTGQVFKDKSSNNLNFKTLLAGSNITITNNTSDITIASTGGGGGATTLDELADVSMPTSARGDIITRGASTFQRLVKGTANQFLRMDATGTDPVWSTYTASGGVQQQQQSYLIYIDTADANKIKALNGITGAIDFTHANDAAQVLGQVFASTANPIYVKVAPGDFNIRSWDMDAYFRRGNFRLEGSGRGVTRFIATDDISDIAGNSRVIAFETTPGSSSINLTSDANIGDMFVIVGSTTGLAVGGYVIVKANEEWNSTLVAGTDKAEIQKIIAIVDNGGGTWKIMLDKALRDTYTTATTARILKQTFIKNITMSDFTIDWAAGTDNTNMLLSFMCVDGLVAKNIELKNARGAYHTGLVVDMCMNVHCEDFDMIIDAPDFIQTGPYGISMRAASEACVFSNFRFRGGWRHCFTTTTDSHTSKMGIPRDITITDCTAETSGECAFDTHGEGDGIHFINCSTYAARSAGGTAASAIVGTDDTDGFNTRSRNTTFENCKVFGNRGDGFSCSANTYGIMMSNCFADNLRLGRKAFNIGSNCHDVIISNCIATNIDHEAITVNDGSYNNIIKGFVARNCCRSDTTLAVISVNQTTDLNISDVMIDASNTAVPLNIDSDALNVVLDSVNITSATKDPTIAAGKTVKWNERTCRGRIIGRPPFKIGRIEGTSTTGGGTGLWEGNFTEAGTAAKNIESTDGTFREYTQSTLNTVAGLKTVTYCRRDNPCYIRIVFRIETATNLRFFAGWSSDDAAVGPAGADPLASKSGIMLKLDTSVDGNMKVYHNSGDATSTTGATILAADTNKHQWEIRPNETGGFQYRFDYGTWTSITTDIPASSTGLCMQLYLENLESGVQKRFNAVEMYTEVAQK